MSSIRAASAPGNAAPFRASSAAGLSFRAMTGDDLAFLCALYGTTRAAELAPVPWSEADKAAFVRMQFSAQHAHYTHHYPNAARLIVQYAGEPVGRLYVDRWAREHRIVDIALMPAHCRRGFGTAILSDLLAEAAAAGKCVTIHVEKHNPALRLYRRLGSLPPEDPRRRRDTRVWGAYVAQLTGTLSLAPGRGHPAHLYHSLGALRHWAIEYPRRLAAPLLETGTPAGAALQERLDEVATLAGRIRLLLLDPAHALDRSRDRLAAANRLLALTEARR